MTNQKEYGTVTAYLCCKGASEAIEFYARAFGATERFRIPMGDGLVGHAELVIGRTTIYLSDEAPELGALSPTTLGGATAAFVLVVPDADTAVARAVGAGARLDRPVTDSPHGRGGWITDPFGHRWSLLQSEG